MCVCLYTDARQWGADNGVCSIFPKTFHYFSYSCIRRTTFKDDNDNWEETPQLRLSLLLLLLVSGGGNTTTSRTSSGQIHATSIHQLSWPVNYTLMNAIHWREREREREGDRIACSLFQSELYPFHFLAHTFTFPKTVTSFLPRI